MKLSLVSCSIDMVQATSIRERIRFNIIDRDTGSRVRYRQVDAETGEEVPQEDQVKCYKAADGSYVLLDPEELDEVALESPRTVDIEAFVPQRKIDEICLDAPYYIFPDDEIGTDAFGVIREAVRQDASCTPISAEQRHQPDGCIAPFRAIQLRRRRRRIVWPGQQGRAPRWHRTAHEAAGKSKRLKRAS